MGQSFQGHIQELARAGIVTHVIENPPSVDSVFAVAKVQDLPEVRFAAAFEDGSLAIGCPDGLPEQLETLAKAVVLAEPDAEPSDALGGEASTHLESKIDALIALVEAGGAQAAEPQIDLNELKQMMAEVAGSSDDEPDRFAALEASLAEINTALTEQTALDSLIERLDGLQATLASAGMSDGEAISSALDEIRSKLDNRDTAGSPDLLEAVEGQISDLKAAFVDTLDGRLDTLQSKLAETASKGAGADGTLVQVNEAVSSGLEALTPALDALAAGQKRLETVIAEHPDSVKIASLLNPLQVQISELAAQRAEATEVVDLSRLEETLTNLPEVLLAAIAAKAPDDTKEAEASIVAKLDLLIDDIGALKSRPEQRSIDLTTMEATVSRMADEIARLVDQPVPTEAPNVAPEIQERLTEIAEGVKTVLSQSSAAISAPDDGAIEEALGRLEAAIAQMTEMMPAEFEALGAKVEAVQPNTTIAGTPELSELSVAQTDIAERLADLGSMDGKLQALAAQIAALAKRSDRHDAAELQSALSQMQSSLDATMARMDNAWNAQSEATTEMLEPVTKELGGMTQRLSQIEQHFANTPASHDGDLGTQLTELAASVGQLAEPLAKIDSLAENLSRLENSVANVRAPTIDLAPQRASFAQFETALNVVITRLEGVAEQFASAPGEPEDVADVDGKINDLRLEIANIQEHQARILQAIEEQASQLASTAAPQLDLTAQRKSFAQFETVLNSVITRLEGVAEKATVPESGTEQPPVSEALDALSQAFASLRDDVIEIKEVQEAELTSLRSQISTMVSAPAPQLDLTAQRQSLARFGTALSSVLNRFETIATRIDEKAAPEHVSVENGVPFGNADAGQPDEDTENLAPDLSKEMPPEELLFAAAIQETAEANEIIQSDEELAATERSDPVEKAEILVVETPGTVLNDMDGALAAEDEFTAGEMAGSESNDTLKLNDNPMAEAENGGPGIEAEMLADGTNAEDGARPTSEVGEEPSGSGNVPPFFSDDRIALDELRYGFAEMIAMRIRDNALAGQKANGVAHPEDV